MFVFFVFILVILLIYLEGKIYQKYALSHLHYDCKFSQDQAFEGEEVELIETVTNRNWLPIASLKLELFFNPIIHFPNAPIIDGSTLHTLPSIFSLRGYEKITRRRKVLCRKRGIATMQEVTLVSKDFFNLYYSAKTLDIQRSITILPTPLSQPLPKLTSKNLMGDYLTSRQLLTDPFYRIGAKPYSGKEPMNSIDWKSTAKLKQLMVFEHDFTSKQSLTLIINSQSHNTQHGSIINQDLVDQAIKAAASYLEYALESSLPSQLKINASVGDTKHPYESTLGYGKNHIYTILGALAHLRPYNTSSFEVFLDTNCNHLQTSNAIILSAYTPDKIDAYIEKQRLKGTEVTLLVLDYLLEHSKEEVCYA